MASRRSEQGYVLLTLLLIVALMIIAVAAIVPSITFEIKRDREEEMIHRGTQYARAIKAYYKKLGRYPSKIEDLESANNMRFLRKRYKDPLNCKNSQCADFKLLHFGEVQLSLSGIGGGTIPGASPIGNTGGMIGGPGGPGGISGPSTFGNNGPGGNSGFGGNSSSFGQNAQNQFGQNQFGQNQQQTGNPPTGTDPSQAGSQASPGSTPDSTGGSTGDGTNPPGTGGDNAGSNQLGSGQIMGGAIVGVASLCKDKTIREFNHKTKYKDWVFVYDPGTDRGGLITTPYQPQLAGFGLQGQPNLNGQNGSNNGGIGGSGTFGSSSSGMQNSPNAPGYGQQNPPSNPPPQQ